jgi:predicted nucleotidyltransferase
MNNKDKIINYLGKNIGEGYTMHELSKILKIPYASFYRSVNGMKELLSIQNVGKSKVLQLNRDNSILKAHLTVASDEEKKEYLSHKSLIRMISKELDTKDIVVLFGSYAKKSERKRSDIDILVVNKKGNKSISFKKFETLLRKEINSVFVTEKEFKLMLKEKEENVGKQVLKNHIILNNPDKFWRLTLDAI